MPEYTEASTTRRAYRARWEWTLLNDGIGAREARARRQRDRQRDIALVLRGTKPRGVSSTRQAGQRHQAYIQHAATAHRARQQHRGDARVAATHAHPATRWRVTRARSQCAHRARALSAHRAASGSRAASAGDSVSDTTSEITVAEAMVSANCL